MEVGGREPHELLYQSDRTVVTRGWSPSARRSVVTKLALGPAALARVQHEAAILRQLAQVPGVAQPLPSPDANALVFPDEGLIPLSDARTDPRWDPAAVPELALRLAAILVPVHDAGVIHRDLNPSNILVSRPEMTPTLADFDLSGTVARPRPEFADPQEILGRLPYLAPEQTSRTAFAVDHRSDLYGLGATLFELVTGRPPFGSGDPLQVIRDILSQVPPTLSDLAPDVPEPLSRIVARLLEKEPDRRYQSAQGLAYDLAAVVASPRVPITLGLRDFPSRLVPPTGLVGRDRETTALMDAFTTARHGAPRLLLVSGGPGVGKSALINLLRPAVATHGGWFICGKADQYNHEAGSNVFAQAIEALGEFLLAQPQADLQRYRDLVHESLGTNAGLAVAAVPSLQRFLGVPPEIATGDPVETERRLLGAAADLLRSLASPDHPIVMMLDDLQWADPSALQVIDTVLADDRIRGLLLVGGYRDAEVDSAHALDAMLRHWQQPAVRVDRIRLDNFGQPQLSVFLGRILRVPDSQAAPLAAVLSERTSGNPFDTVELLNALRTQGALTLGEQGWAWDDGAIRRFVGSGSVIDLLRDRLERLPLGTRDQLTTLACLGGEVAVDLLTIASGQDPQTTRSWLAPALEDGLLVTGDGHGTIEGHTTVRFVHDRVRQAAYSGLSDRVRTELRLTVARRLTCAGRAVEAAQQYLLAGDAVIDPAERYQAAQLFRIAATRARLISNYAWVERYLRTAERLLPVGTPPDDPAVAGLAEELHAALYALGRLEEADEIYRTVEQQHADPVELAAPACVQIASLTNRGHLAEAVSLGVGLLAALGRPVPETDLRAHAATGFDRIEAWLTRTSLDADLSRPTARDPRAVATARVLSRMCPTAFFTDHLLLSWLVVQAHQLWTEHGPQGDLVPCLAHANAYGVGLRPDHGLDHRLVTHVLAVGEDRAFQPGTAHGHFLHAVVLGHWFAPLETVIQEAREAREQLVHHGDLQNASFAFYPSIIGMLDAQSPLDLLATETRAGIDLCQRLGNHQMVEVLLAFRQFVRALQGDTAAPGSFTDTGFEESAHLQACLPNPMAVAYFRTLRAVSAAMFGQYLELDEHTDEVRPLLQFVAGTYTTVIVRVPRILTLAHRLRHATPTGQVPLLAELDDHRTVLAACADQCPENYAHLVHLVDAERTWALGDLTAALAAFDRALCAVDQVARPWHHALLCERAGRCHHQAGMRRSGLSHLAEARHRYLAWGAIAKVRQLDNDFPTVRATVAAETRQRAAAVLQHSTSVTEAGIDMLAILRASQALGTHTDLEQLRRTVVDQLQALTGATGVRLVLADPETGDWFLPPSAERTGSLPVEQAGTEGLLPLAAFRYAERTGEPLLVPDCLQDSRFSSDPYFAELAHCSLMVTPISNHGQLRAMLVLENRLSRAMFTPDRLDAVQLLAGQLAISLENALAARFRALVQRSSDTTLVIGREDTVVSASSAAAGLFGVDKEALTGRPVSSLVEADDRRELLEHLRSAPSTEDGGRTTGWQCRVLRADGTRRWAETTFTDLRDDPAIGGIVLRLRDITERRRLETELRHAQKMESVGQLAAGVAHEINTPIQFIGDNLRFVTDAVTDLCSLVQAYREETPTGPARGDAERLAAALDVEFLVEELPQALGQTRHGVDQVATIVRALKASVAPGGDAKGLVDVNEALRNTMTLANNQLKDVAEVELHLGDLPRVRCHLGDLNQIILTLVRNAADAIAALPQERAGRPLITVGTRCEGSEVVLEVADTGIGIAPEIAGRVFEQFFTTKPVGSGSGQGLAVAYYLVSHRHQGTIDFSSAPGQGTTFTVRLPVDGAPCVPAPRTAPAQTPAPISAAPAEPHSR